MRVRTLELRLLAAALAVGWALGAGLVLVAYRPGGPVDLVVGLVATLPIAIAVAGMAWPPLTRDDRVFAGIVWLALGALLLLVPSIGAILRQLEGGGPQTLVPSVEAGYPWFLALLATSLFAGLGVARHRLGETAVRRRRFVRALAFALAASLLVAAVFAAVALANELALRDAPVAASRFGPTDPAVEPPLCTDPLAVAPAVRLDASLDADVDGGSIGTIELRGTRSRADFRWLAYVATNRELGQHGWARVGDGAWHLAPGRPWEAVPVSTTAGGELDARILDVALQPERRAAAEVHGVDVFEGARARHCRLAIDGASFRLAFPQAGWLVGDLDLSAWRGEIDWWVFADGQLGRVSARVYGPGEALVDGGLHATIRATVTATERDEPHAVVRPRS